MLKSRLDIIRETIAISSKSNGDASAVVTTEAESMNPSDSLPISSKSNGDASAVVTQTPFNTEAESVLSTEPLFLEQSTLDNVTAAADRIAYERNFISSFAENIAISISLFPTNKEWKIDESMQISLRSFLESPHSHGHFYPPPISWNHQKEFMEESGLIIRDSCVPYAKGKKNKSGNIDLRGKGTFCGHSGILEGTQLVFMGLIYHGVFDLVEMKKLWTSCNADDPNSFNKLPQFDFEGHILEVKSNLFIIGHPGCATTMLNENPMLGLNQCVIAKDSPAIIEFRHPVLCFTEIFLLYGENIK